MTLRIVILVCSFQWCVCIVINSYTPQFTEEVGQVWGGLLCLCVYACVIEFHVY